MRQTPPAAPMPMPILELVERVCEDGESVAREGEVVRGVVWDGIAVVAESDPGRVSVQVKALAYVEASGVAPGATRRRVVGGSR